MMRGLLCLVAFCLTLAMVSSEFCKVNSGKYCFHFCCGSSAKEYCCSECKLSVRLDNHPYCNVNSTTTTAPRPASWWDKNGWWVNLLLRIGLPVAFFLVGGIIILVLICTGKINVKQMFSGRRAQQPLRVTAAANQPPSYSQATGVSYPMQPASATVVQTTGAYPMQPTGTTSGAYPVQPPPYTVPPGGSYPMQQPFAVSYPPMSENPNYPPVGGAPMMPPSQEANK